MAKVELLTNAQFNQIIRAGAYPIIDMVTGRTNSWNFGGARNDHYDITPTTPQDATNIEQTINQRDIRLWRPARPVIIVVGNRYIAAGLTHFMHHARIGGGNPGPKYPHIIENGPPWRFGGHVCCYLSTSVGGGGDAPNAAVSAEANRLARNLHSGGRGGQARAACFEAHILGNQPGVLNRLLGIEEKLPEVNHCMENCEFRNRRIYNRVEEVPEWGRPTVAKLVEAGIMQGTGGGNLSIDDNLLRTMVLLDRTNAFDGMM